MNKIRTANSFLLEMTTAMREMVMAELYLSNEQFVKNKKNISLLPLGMQHCLEVYHGIREKLSDEDNDAYLTLIKEVIRYGENAIIRRFVAISQNLPETTQFELMFILFKESRWQELLEVAGRVSNDSAGITGGFWYAIGIAFFHSQEYTVATEALERAKEQGWEKNEIDSYLDWCREAIAND